MSKTVLFDTWTWNYDFDDSMPNLKKVVEDAGKKYTTSVGAISKYNEQRNGKRATLHVPTVQAVYALHKILTATEQHGAIGVQTGSKGEVQYYCAEVDVQTATATGKERIAAVYNAKNGKFRACALDDAGTLLKYPVIASGSDAGQMFLLLLAFASTFDPRSGLYSKEFDEDFNNYFAEKNPMTRDAECMFRMCDNIYRRVETVKGDNSLPVDIPSSGNVPALTKLKIDQGEYAPDRVLVGNFQILKGDPLKKRNPATGLKTMEDYTKAFAFAVDLTDEEKIHIPVMPDSYKPSKYLYEMASMAKAGMRKFMLRGMAGTGKTTDAVALAQALNLPYLRFTCSEGTDEMELVANMIPNTAKADEMDFSDLPSLQDIMMDPATALSKVSGTYEDGISDSEAFRLILKAVAGKGIKQAEKEKDFVMVESDIIKACRRPAVCEIQEPACIAKPATLVKLNGLLDGGSSITLLNGEEVKLNENTVFVFTTNSNYRGCRAFNESVLSRMDEIIDYDGMTAKELAARVIGKVKPPQEEVDNVRTMAEVILDIQKYCETEGISGGVCCSREFENWVISYLVKGDMKESCRWTVISKISDDKEIQDEIMKNVVSNKI